MSELLLPDDVLQATDQYVPAEQVARDFAESRWFRDLLQGVDSRLDLIFVKPGAPSFEHSCRFYIIRRNEMAQPSYWVIQGEQGEYCEPQERHFRRFMQGDSATNPNLWREFMMVREARIARARRNAEELRREVREKLKERLDFVYDGPGLLVPGRYKEQL
jgi:hypothetical protein